MALLSVTLAASVATAVPLFVDSLRDAAARPAVVWLHAGVSSAFFAVLSLKLILLGARAKPARARRLWSSLVAHVGSALSGYTLLTGVLLFFSAAWADQHLAASFWMLAAVGVHSRQYGRRAAALVVGALARGHRARGPERPGATRRRPAARGPTSAGDAIQEPAPPPPENLRAQASSPAAATPARRALPAEKRRLVVVGTGLAGLAVVEEALRRRPADSWDITMLGEEPGRPYNRVLLSSLLAGTCDPHEIESRPASWFAASGIDVRAGLPVATISPERRAVVDSGGGPHPYDALVLATGSRPFIPPIPGVEAGHVFAFRTRADADRIAAAAAPAGAVVVGGGLLGLEAAAGLMARDVKVTVVEAANRLMPEQLDAGAAGMLERALARRGLRALVGRSVRSIEPRSVRLDDGRELAADLVVVAAGIRPEVSLARKAGIDTGRGILVDDEMATSAPGVWAIGECAEHRGAVYGLWPPLLEQAQVAGASLSGSPSAFRGAAVATTLKVSGVSVFAGGPQSAGPGQREVAWSDDERGTYAKLVLRGDRPLGALVVGDEGLGQQFARLLREGALTLGLLDTLSPPVTATPAPDGAGADAAPETADASLDVFGDTELVCVCRQITRGEIVREIRARGLGTCAEVERATGASGGCGSCRGRVEALIALTA